MTDTRAQLKQTGVELSERPLQVLAVFIFQIASVGILVRALLDALRGSLTVYGLSLGITLVSFILLVLISGPRNMSLASLGRRTLAIIGYAVVYSIVAGLTGIAVDALLDVTGISGSLLDIPFIQLDILISASIGLLALPGYYLIPQGLRLRTVLRDGPALAFWYPYTVLRAVFMASAVFTVPTLAAALIAYVLPSTVYHIATVPVPLGVPIILLGTSIGSVWAIRCMTHGILDVSSAEQSQAENAQT